MPALLKTVDPEGLLEYSVVYTDRALNHMSLKFQKTMQDLSNLIKDCYAGDHVAIIPGSGTAGMEAVARQLAHGKKCLSLRNGFFNFRWTQIFEAGKIPAEEIVLKAQAVEQSTSQPYYEPAPLAEVIKTIETNKPDLVFATHVETSAGIMLPDDYIKAVAKTTHDNGGLFILDSIASGALWVNMCELDIDILTSAPQKGWSSTPCAGIVVANETAYKKINETQSDSFFLDLKKWLEIMKAYENGGHAYHATMPTDSLVELRNTMQESFKYGLDNLKQKQEELGKKIRKLLAENGIKTVSDSTGKYAASSIVVAYTSDLDIKSGKKFAQQGIQIASGVPLKCDEPASFSTFRLGLLGLDKLENVDRTVELFSNGLEDIFSKWQEKN